MTFRCQNTFSIKHVTTQTHKHFKFGHKTDNDVETFEIKFTHLARAAYKKKRAYTNKINALYSWNIPNAEEVLQTYLNDLSDVKDDDQYVRKYILL